MTVAAYDGTALAVDGAMSWGNLPITMLTPKAVICGAWVIAMAGETRQTLAVQAGLKDVAFDEDTPPLLPSLNGSDPKFEALAVSHTRLALYLAAPHPIMLDMPYMAIGSGCDLAIGAMAHGADALTAIRTAIKHDMQCNYPISLYRYNTKTDQWYVNRYET